ncbi:MAG: carboxypeptidase regulatory-like domain-containing protein [Gemmatimonadaceae bacterium]
MMTGYRALAGFAVLLFPDLVAAQAVSGTVIDRGDRPVPGVVVLLLDRAGNEAARALTNDRGEYRVRAGSAGVFRLRTLRIGFRPVTSDPILLGADAEVSQRLALTDVASFLDTIKVTGRNACRVRPDSAMATFAIWEQVRTALIATQLTAGTGSIGTRVVSYQRSLHPEKGHVLRQQLFVNSSVASAPWSSLSADSLRRAGYIGVALDGTTSFYAPDLGVLLSDIFVEDHCFRLASESDAARIGIAFEPTRDRRRVPEIRGTVWVDRKSSELRRLEFRYVNVARELEAAAGGEMDFARMADGSWVISRWHIRMPILVTERIAGRGMRSRGVETWVREIRVQGGELAMVSRGRDTLWSQPVITLSGRIVDAQTGQGVADAHVALGGTFVGAQSDAAGAFRIQRVLPGHYTVRVQTPSLESIAHWHSVDFDFVDSTTTLTVAVPNAEQLAATLCGTSGGNEQRGVVTGTVALWGDSVPPHDTKVVAEWTEDDTTGTRKRTRWLETRTDARGTFRICGLPYNRSVVVRAERVNVSADAVEVQVAADRRFVRADLLLEQQVERGAVLSGVVLSDVNAQPIADVEVALPALGKNAFTNDRGAYRIAGILPGTHEVVVRRLGYKQVASPIAFHSGATVERQTLLSRIVTLDTVAVRASPRDQMMREFEDNRRLGLGRFWTRAQLEKLEGVPMSAIMSQINGSSVVRGRGNAAWMARSRGVLQLPSPGGRLGSTAGMIEPDEFSSKLGAPVGCYADVWVDNLRVYSGRQEEPLFNLGSITPSLIEAMEYYATPAQTPARYANLNTVCGVLVIWTRR